MWWILNISTVALIFALVDAEPLKLCVRETVTNPTCTNLNRGNSPVACERVFDSADCAIKLSSGQADFGVFTAEELLLVHQFYPTGLEVIAELKHKDHPDDALEFETVAIVPSSYTPTRGGFNALFGGGFCHPGFSKTSTWNDFVLKFFEQTVINTVSRSDQTIDENELTNLRDFFRTSCRPGEWVADDKIDAELKKRFPELCQLCDRPESCSYTTDDHHEGALNCLTSGRGNVTYTSLRYANDYFKERRKADFQFLCDDGTVQALTTPIPCSWFREPWKTVVAAESKADDIKLLLQEALSQTEFTKGPPNWREVLSSIIQEDAKAHIYQHQEIFPAGYLDHKQRGSLLPKMPYGRKIRWCTVGELETNKCLWISAQSKILGISPEITCKNCNSTFRCFHEIANNKADIIASDSNYGYLARKVFGLKPILYSETSKDRNSLVVAVVRDRALNRVEDFRELRGRNVCFPEYGGIAWFSFWNLMRDERLVPNSCNYSRAVASFVNGACAPGAFDRDHNVSVGHEAVDVLCKFCGDNCDANPMNPYFGDDGALRCLEGPGDIAFLEARNLKSLMKDGKINQTNYRVLCKNGTLAAYTGFDVDEACALSVTIDSEVLTRRNESENRIRDMTLALLKIEEALGYGGSNLPINLYDSFNGTLDLLFKDSTTALVSINEDIREVQAYKDLFAHVDRCSGAHAIRGYTIMIIIGLIFVISCVVL